MATKFSFLKLKNEKASYLSQWLPKQKKKMGNGPSKDGVTYLRECVGACVKLDTEMLGGTLNPEDFKGTKGADKVARDFKNAILGGYCFEFAKAYQSVFGEKINAITDPHKIINHEETAKAAANDNIPLSFSEKIKLEERRIAMIDSTMTLLESHTKDDRFCEDISDEQDKVIINPWFKNTARLEYEACIKFLRTPKPSAISTSVGFSKKTKLETAKDNFKAEAKACGIAKLEMEREFDFGRAKITFKGGAEAGLTAKASVEGGLKNDGNSSTIAKGKATAEVFFGLKTTAQASLESDVLDVDLKGEAMAGAQAKVTCEGAITATGVSGKLKAEAFAGAKAKATGTAKLKMFGLVVAEETVTATISAGIGASGELGLKADLFDGVEATVGLDATIGVGGGVTTKTSVNHYNLKLAGERGSVVLLNMMHERRARMDGYMKVDWGEHSENNKLYARLKGDLEGKKEYHEGQLKSLRQKAEQSKMVKL